VDSINAPDIDDHLLTELSALADGTLSPERRAEVEQRVASSAELRDLYDRQLRALSAVRGVAGAERAPARLRARIEAERPAWRSTARRRLVYGCGVAGVVAAVALALALVLPAGTPGAPSVSEAAGLAALGPVSAAPGPDPRAPDTRLTQNVERVYFPNWSLSLGWNAVGQRIDRLAGRRTVTVYYHGHGTTIAYTIVSGSRLAKPAATIVRVNGRWLRTLSLNGRLIVTWRLDGHTCILSGAGVTARVLESLASYA
jgi:hypothetical protein